MSYPYERYGRNTRRPRDGRGALSYWVPLGLTVVAATMALSAWVWSERHDEEDAHDEEHAHDETSSSSSDDDKKHRARQAVDGTRPPEDWGDGGAEASATQEQSTGFVARMSGAIRRSPSPQQLLDQAGRRVVAGVTAAGAAVEGALSSIREEEKDDYGDHSRWAQEGGERDPGGELGATTSSVALADAPARGFIPRVAGEAAASGNSQVKSEQATQYRAKGRRRVVAVVVASETTGDRSGDEMSSAEEASILSYFPSHVDHETIQLFVLIYAPNLKQHPLSGPGAQRPPGSVTSSFSNIAHDDARTPLEESDRALGAAGQESGSMLFVGAGHATDAKQDDGSSSPFQAVYERAQALVENNTMILPFTVPNGHVHILRHLAPATVYIQESLTGITGEAVTHMSGWVGQIVVVVGAEGGHGGLVDSDDEGARDTESSEKWWQKGDRVRLGKGVNVVDSLRIGEDWRRRVQGHD